MLSEYSSINLFTWYVSDIAEGCHPHLPVTNTREAWPWSHTESKRTVCLQNPLAATWHGAFLFSPELVTLCDMDLETRFGVCDIGFHIFYI